MRLRFTPRAFADREAIFGYLNARSPEAATRVMMRLHHAIGMLSSRTLSGHETNIDGVRVLFVGRYPYKVFFRVVGDTIEILHIRHTARRPTDLDQAA